MAGRSVVLPAQVTRVATVGPVPVINSFIFALGEGSTIVNGLPPFAATPRWKYQAVFAPNIAGAPAMQAANNAPNTEALLQAKPDVVFVMDQSALTPLDQAGLPAMFLAWRQPADVKTVVNLLAQVFGEPQQGQAYADFFDATVKRVSDRVAAVPPEQRPTVLYFSPKTLSQPQLIAEWWIPTAGGISVTNNGRTEESISVSAEQVLAWNPAVMIVTAPDEQALVYADSRFAAIQAVRDKRVLVIPQGAHNWGNRTIEQPLTVLWLAKTLYPELFSDVDLLAEVKGFYARFFGTTLTDEQVQEILSGRVGSS